MFSSCPLGDIGYFVPVLRILDVDPGSDFFLSRIQGSLVYWFPDPDPHPRISVFLSPDPGYWLLIFFIPIKAPDQNPESGSATLFCIRSLDWVVRVLILERQYD